MSERDPDIKNVLKRFNEGDLFVHLFEFKRSEMKKQLPALCGVLNGDEGSEFANRWRGSPGTPEGMRGLAATALKEGFPVPVWTDLSHVGLLFDGSDKKNVKPVFVSSCDAFSGVADDRLRITHGETDAMAEIGSMQGVVRPEGSSPVDHVIDMADRPERAAVVDTARRALGRMWEKIGEMGWEAYMADAAKAARSNPRIRPGMNEVSLIAHLDGANAIVVADPRGKAEDAEKKLAGYIADAKYAQEVIGKKFGHDLPIMVYSPVTGRLASLDEVQQALADSGAHLPAGSVLPLDVGPARKSRHNTLFGE